MEIYTDYKLLLKSLSKKIEIPDDDGKIRFSGAPVLIYDDKLEINNKLEINDDVHIRFGSSSSSTYGYIIWYSSVDQLVMKSLNDLYIRAERDINIIGPSELSFPVQISGDTRIYGDLDITGTLSKGSGSCLTTDIFYNNSDYIIHRGMVVVADESNNSLYPDRVFSKPICACKPCDKPYDHKVLGIKVYETPSHGSKTKEEINELKKQIKKDNPNIDDLHIKIKEDTSENLSYGRLIKNKTNMCYTELDYKLNEELSKTYPKEKMHVGVLGQYYCLVDADIKPIRVGDLLTTSETLGHAMRADRRRNLEGRIVAKAMESKKKGKGLIKVFINL